MLRAALKAHGAPDLQRAKPGSTHFAELARTICYQQLAGRAAAAIHGRFAALFDGPPTPEAVLALSMEELRSVGLSGSKAASITDLAEKVDAGLVELDRMNRLPDDVVVRELILVRGIGEWTAHMFLMFQLGRLDVWPTGDYGVRRLLEDVRPPRDAHPEAARTRGRPLPPLPLDRRLLVLARRRHHHALKSRILRRNPGVARDPRRGNVLPGPAMTRFSACVDKPTS